MKAKCVRMGDLRIGEEFTCYGFRYEKVSEDHVRNMRTGIVVHWSKKEIVAKVFHAPELKIVTTEKNNAN